MCIMILVGQEQEMKAQKSIINTVLTVSSKSSIPGTQSQFFFSQLFFFFSQTPNQRHLKKSTRRDGMDKACEPPTSRCATHERNEPNPEVTPPPFNVRRVLHVSQRAGG